MTQFKQGFVKEFTHDKTKDIFESPKELAIQATSLGLTTDAFLQLYFDNLETSERGYLNTAQRFRGVLQKVERKQYGQSEDGRPIFQFVVHYTYGRNNEWGEIRMLGTSSNADTMALAYKISDIMKEKEGENCGIPCYFTKVYQVGKNGNEYVALQNIHKI